MTEGMSRRLAQYLLEDISRCSLEHAGVGGSGRFADWRRQAASEVCDALCAPVRARLLEAGLSSGAVSS